MQKCIFAARFGLLGDFYGVGSKIIQIMEKPFVLGHSVAKQTPQ